MKSTIVAVFLSCFILGSPSIWSIPEDRDLLSEFFSIITPSGFRIVLRYTSIDEAQTSLGKPEKKTYYQQGGEDFFWKDFWVYHYHANNLRIYFESKTRRIIRIDAYWGRLANFKLPFGIEKSLDFKSILAILREIEGISYGQDRNSIIYSIASKGNHAQCIILDMASIRTNFISFYYILPWKGYQE